MRRCRDLLSVKAFSIHGMANKCFFGPNILTLGNSFPQPTPAPPPSGNWTVRAAFPLANVAGFTSSATRAVLTDGNGAGAYSDDGGVSWTNCTGFTAANDGFALVYNGAGVWIAACRNGVILKSADGATWAASATLAPIFGNPSLAFGNGLFLCVTRSSSQNLNSFTSPDGVTWTNHGTATPSILTVFGFNAGNYFGQSQASSHVFSTPDGLTYTETATPQFNGGNNGINSMVFGGGTYVATDGAFPSVVQSSPSTVWVGTAITQPLDDTATAVTYKSGTWVLVGQTLADTSPQAATSTDLVTWTKEDMALGAGEFENVQNCATLAGVVMAWTFDGKLTTRN
jgi:hypothetical protein